MDTNTKTFLDYMEHSDGGSITYVAEKITQEYEQEYDIIEDDTARSVLNRVDKLVSTHAQGGSIAFEMGTKVNMHIVQLAPLTTWLQRFSGRQGVS
jgi:hypothetical protein